MTKKQITLLSGGLDSVVLLHVLANEGVQQHAFHVDLGGESSLRELASARFSANQLGVPLEVLDLSSLRKAYVGRLPDNVVRLDGGDTIDPKPNDIFPYSKIPTGAGIMHAATTYLANLEAVERINVAYLKPQCSGLGEYFKKVADAFHLLNPSSPRVSLETPFGRFDKAVVIKRGADLQVPFAMTWSCLESGTEHCGKCVQCVDRKEAFATASVEDPTSYAE